MVTWSCERIVTIGMQTDLFMLSDNRFSPSSHRYTVRRKSISTVCFNIFQLSLKLTSAMSSVNINISLIRQV